MNNNNQNIYKLINKKTEDLTKQPSSLSLVVDNVEKEATAFYFVEETKLYLHKEIIPLFAKLSPVQLKNEREKASHKFEFTIINQRTNLIYKVKDLNEILKIFNRGLNLYNYTLNNFLKTENNLILFLIREIKYLEYNKLNIIYKNYTYLLNRYSPIYKFRNLKYKLELFLPNIYSNRKIQINYLYIYHIRLKSQYLYKNFKYLGKFISNYNPTFYSLSKGFSNSSLDKEANNNVHRTSCYQTTSFYASTLEATSASNSFKLGLASKASQINKINNLPDIYLIKKILEKGLKLYLNINSLIKKNKININILKYKYLFNPVYKHILKINNTNLSKSDSLERGAILRSRKNTNVLLNLNNIKLNLKKTFFKLKYNNINNINITLGRIESIISRNKKLHINNVQVQNQAPTQTTSTYSTLYALEASSALAALDLEKKNSTKAENKEAVCFASNAHSLSVFTRNQIIIKYLKEMSKFNMCPLRRRILLRRKGIFIFYNKIIAYNFNIYTNKLIKNIYKLLYASFKSMYCLISKPVFHISPLKINIQLFYYLFIPNIFKLKAINLYEKPSSSNLYPFEATCFFSRRKELKRKLYTYKKQYSKYRKFKSFNNLLNLSSNSLSKVFNEKLNILLEILSNLFKKPVELNLIRLHYPYFDSNILVNLLGIMINKIKLRIIIRRLFANTVIKNLNNVNNLHSEGSVGEGCFNSKKAFGAFVGNNNIIPAFLTGINIRVAGRLYTQKVVPRKTVKTVNKGASAKSKVNFLDVARYSNKNRRGAFSITVKSGQNYF